MIWLFKRLYCFFVRHDWLVAPEADVMKPGSPLFQCRNCGKRENL